MPRAILVSAMVSLLLVCGPAFTAPVVFERDTPIRVAPKLDAAIRGQVPEGTRGQAAERRGAWLAVRTSAGNGWVPSFNVRYGQSTPKTSAATPSALHGVRSIAGGNVTATMGVRGLEKKPGAEDAKFDGRQLAALEKSRATQGQAKAAAVATGLRARDVEFFEER